MTSHNKNKFYINGHYQKVSKKDMEALRTLYNSDVFGTTVRFMAIKFNVTSRQMAKFLGLIK